MANARQVRLPNPMYDLVGCPTYDEEAAGKEERRDHHI